MIHNNEIMMRMIISMLLDISLPDIVLGVHASSHKVPRTTLGS